MASGGGHGAITGRTIGIDFGAHAVRVASFVGGRVIIHETPEGTRSFPNILAFSPADGTPFVGERARAQAARNAGGTIDGGGKAVLGVASCVKQAAGALGAAALVCVPAYAAADGAPVTAVAAATHVLAYAKAIAETGLGARVENAVISAAPWMTLRARAALRAAGAAAGLRVLRITDDTALAALAYCEAACKTAGEHTVLVYDLGGSALKVSAAIIEDGIVEIRAAVADRRVSGSALDEALVSRCLRERGAPHSARAARRIRDACEAAKRELSGAARATVRVDGYAAPPDGDLVATVLRADFEAADVFSLALEPVERVLREGGIARDSVQTVLLLGGASRVPRIAAALRGFFGGRDLLRGARMDFNEAVVAGAAIQGAILSKVVTGTPLDSLLLFDVCPHSLGIEGSGGAMISIIKRHTTFPAKKTLAFNSVVTPPTLTMREVAAGASWVIGTGPRGLPVAVVNVFAGENAVARDNEYIGTVQLTYTPAVPTFNTRVEVVFDLCASMILRVAVSAKDGSGAVAECTFSGDFGGGPRDSFGVLQPLDKSDERERG